MKRIAIVGGKDFSERKLIEFVQGVKEKYPFATIVTGNGAGAERSVKELAEAAGLTLEIAPVYTDLFGKEALLCQVNSILLDADVIVVVGSKTSGRAKRAFELWHRINMHTRDARGGLLKVKGGYVSKREPWNVTALHVVATAEAKPPPLAAAA